MRWVGEEIGTGLQLKILILNSLGADQRDVMSAPKVSVKENRF